MHQKISILFTLLLLRGIFNFLTMTRLEDGVALSVIGNIDKIERNISKCNIYLGHYFGTILGDCYFSQGQKIKLIGRYKWRVIDSFYGDLWLSDAEISKLDDNKNRLSYEEPHLDFWGGWREKISQKYRKYLPSKEASLVAGIVLGDKRGISGDFYEEMVSSGTIHIAVASGYNLMILGGSLLSLLFWWFRRSVATVVAIVVMFGYTLLSGADPPVVRAWVMASILFIGMAIGRSAVSWWALLLTAWVMVILDLAMIRSVSFQLSVAASVGLMIVEPKMRTFLERFNGKWVEIVVGSGFLTTLAATLTTSPFIWWYFQRLSLMGLVSNLFILPLVPALMFLGALMIVLGGLVSWPVYLLAHTIVLIIGWLS